MHTTDPLRKNSTRSTPTWIVDSLTDLAVTTNPAARGSGKRGFGGLSLSFSFTEPSLLSGKILLKTAPLLLICQKYEVVRLKSAARIVKRERKKERF